MSSYTLYGNSKISEDENFNDLMDQIAVIIHKRIIRKFPNSQYWIRHFELGANTNTYIGQLYSDFLTQEVPPFIRAMAKYVVHDTYSDDEMESKFEELWEEFDDLLEEMEEVHPRRWTKCYDYCYCAQVRVQQYEKRKREEKERRKQRERRNHGKNKYKNQNQQNQ